MVNCKQKVNIAQNISVAISEVHKSDAAKDRACEQLIGYMETKNTIEGYLLPFDFRKSKTGEYNAEWVDVGGKKVLMLLFNERKATNGIF